MTNLERLAALILAEWQAECGRTDAALMVGDLLDNTYPYKKARKAMALDSSEEYDALVLRLLAEEAGLVIVAPPDASEMAKITLAAKIPDLDQLQLLRSATLTFSDDAVSRLEGVRPLPPPSALEEAVQDVLEDDPEATNESGIQTRNDQVIPIDRQHHQSATRPKVPPEEFLTGVVFTPPEGICWQCQTPWPPGRSVHFCVECGADQVNPVCNSCGAALERTWKHCPDCGEAQDPG